MEAPSRVGIVVALAIEARTLAHRAPAADELVLLPSGALLAMSGMGLEAAEHDARALIDAGCTALASWGLAGALDPRLSPGTIVIPEVLALEGAPELNASSAWRLQALELLDRRARVVDAEGTAGRTAGRSGVPMPAAVGGRLLTSRKALARAAEKRNAFLTSGAVAVDMESYALAAVAAARGLPFIAVRAIVDAAADEVPPMLLDLAGPDGRLAIGRLAARILGSPRNFGALLGLGRRFRVARRSLRAAAGAGAPGSAPAEAQVRP